MADNIKQNYLSPVEFRFIIKRLPYVEFFIQEATVPGLSLASVETGSPFRTQYWHGDKLTYEQFTINFRVDENMNNYQELFNWMVGLTFPDRFSQFANLEESDDGLYSDATLMIMTNGKNPNMQVVFKDIFPINLGTIQMDTTAASVDYVTVDATFQTNSFEIRPLA